MAIISVSNQPLIDITQKCYCEKRSISFINRESLDETYRDDFLSKDGVLYGIYDS